MLLLAYSDGVNDFINGIGYYHDEITAFWLPLEFQALEITEVEPWHPVDTLMLLKFLNFHLTSNWGQELLRDILSQHLVDPELIKDLIPFNSGKSQTNSILDDADMKQAKLFLEEPLVKRFESRTEMDFRDDSEIAESQEKQLKYDKGMRYRQKEGGKGELTTEAIDDHEKLARELRAKQMAAKREAMAKSQQTAQRDAKIKMDKRAGTYNTDLLASNNWVISGNHT
jgi:acyl-homoserine lactone acylase PvdQ